MSSAAPDPLGGTPSAEFIPPACTCLPRPQARGAPLKHTRTGRHPTLGDPGAGRWAGSSPPSTWGRRGRWAAKAREARLARRRFGNKIEMVRAWRNGCWIEASSSKRYARTGFLLEVLRRPQCSFMAMSRCNAIARTQASRHHQFAMSTVTYSLRSQLHGCRGHAITPPNTRI